MRVIAALFGLMLGLVAAGSASALQGDYNNSDLASDALRLAAQAAQDGDDLKDQTPDSLRKAAAAALAKGDTKETLHAIAGLIAIAPDDSAAWLAYSRAEIASGKTDEILQAASTAAYLAYTKAADKTTAAQALAQLGAVFAQRELWRPSLNAYHASLTLADDPAIRATYQKERETYGFRILDYKVDKDSAAPRACFQFSESLASGHVDFASYVSVAGIDRPAVSSEDQQICVDGLHHSEHYTITLRQGLPSSVGEQLLRTAVYDLYVRDRSPQVHFTGKNYVLPRIGQQGIPVVSVNAKKVAVQILRVADRSLLPIISSSDFLTQLSSYRLQQFKDSDARKIWKGTLDVASELNKDVTTAFPVLEAVGTLEAGVYIMTAKPADALQEGEDDYSNVATQWFVVSDLGLTALSSRDGLHIFVRSLTTAKPLIGISLRLVARDNEILATKPSDASGYVRFEPGLSRGSGGLAPGLIVAEDGKGDYGFLNLQQSAFDLTDRGVKGRDVTQPLDAQVFTERGVYRSGETVYVTALLRDDKGVAKEGVPLTLVARRPDGVEYRRALIADQGAGGRSFALPLLPSSASGTWRVQAYVDPKGAPVGETTFLVEDYVPERLDFKLKPRETQVRAGDTTTIDTNSRYLYGAPGSGLDVGGEVTVEAAGDHGLPVLQGYQAGLQDQTFEAVSKDLPTIVTTDDKGDAAIDVPIPDIAATQPLEAKVVLRVGEPGGRAVERNVTLPILPKGGLIGVKKDFASLGDGDIANFDVIAINSSAARVARKGVAWSLYRLITDYQWYNQDGHWDFEEVKSSRRVATGTLDLSADALGKIAAPVELGDYRLDVSSIDPNDAPTSVTFGVGWSGEATAGAPDLLEVTLDKEDYAPGDAMKLKIASRFAGTATIAILNDQLEYSALIDVTKGDNVVSVPVGANWGAGAYAVVFAHRPLDQAAQRNPGRALGLAWFSVAAASHKLDIAIGAPEKLRPHQHISVPVTLAGLQPGDEAYVTLAAVDVGILNLTHYQTPDPSAYFYGQRTLATEIRDLYGFLIDGMQGTAGAIRSGGDAGGELQGNKPTEAPLALFSGVVKVGADGKAEVGFDLPPFNGTMRLAAVAWTKTRVGSTSEDVIVRDPVVVQPTLPRFLALKDHSRLYLQIDNVEGQAGAYSYDVAIDGPVAVGAHARGTIKLKVGERTALSVPLVATGVGLANINFKMHGPKFATERNFALNVEAGTSSVYRRIVRQIAAGDSFLVSKDLTAEFLPGTGRVSAAVASLSGIDAAGLLQSLADYPFECSEQLVSRTMPLLYVGKLADPKALAFDTGIADRVNRAIAILLARQDSSGAFGLWSSDNASDEWLNAFVTDFLTRAREEGYDVPQQAFGQALERLRNFVANTSDVEAGQSAGLAYAVYVLARNGRPVMEDLRYLADARLSVFTTPLARAQIAAALALLGDRGRAAKVFAAASDSLAQANDKDSLTRVDFGSRLRDGAGLLTLAVEGGANSAQIDKAAQVVENARDAITYASTQEESWMVLAAEALAARDQSISLGVDGTTHSGAYYRTWLASTLAVAPVKLVNQGQQPVSIALTTSGNPITPEPAAGQGYTLERGYYSLDGTPLDPAKITQNDRFVITLKVTESVASYSHLVLDDPLPAGLEIDNPDLYDGGDVDALSWVKSDVQPTHTEYRDDRFVAAFDRDGQSAASFAVAYIVRAVTPGHYVAPAATIQDMYRPQRFARTDYGTVIITAPK
ncbi:MAG: alpha-2-macroglobulin family protein [Methylovirgula sp.]